MKHIKFIIYLLMIMFFTCNRVSALTCSNSEAKDLNTIATHVKVSYELIDKSETKEFVYNDSTKIYNYPNYSFEISIYNITEEIYITLKDDVTNKEKNIYYYDTKNGTYTFTNNDFGRIYKYTVGIKSASNNCYGQKLKNITLIKPKYNAYSEYTYCENSSNYYCQKFTTTELNLKDDDDFLKKIKTNSNSNKPTTTTTSKIEKVEDLINKNYIIYVSTFIVVVIITIIIIAVKRKKNSKKDRGWEL